MVPKGMIPLNGTFVLPARQPALQMLARVEELERLALELDMPSSYSQRSFNLKAHIRALMASARTDA